MKSFTFRTSQVMASILWIFVVSCLFIGSQSRTIRETYELSNEYLLIQFDSSLGTIQSVSYNGLMVKVTNETGQIFVENRPINCSTLIKSQMDVESINFTYACTNENQFQLTTIYTLKARWKFFEKQFFFTTIQNESVTSLETSLTIVNQNISSVLIMKNRQDMNKQHGIFLRVIDFNFGMSFVWQHPFATYQITTDNRTVSTSYPIGIDQNYLSEGFLFGFEDLSNFWQSNGLNYAERKAFEEATSFFYPVAQRQRSIKHAVGWDSNDYQIDISTTDGQAEYQRLIDRCSQLGIDSITFAPSNSNVSRRDQGTDDWGWESVLWLTLGEKIRLEQWKPYRDPIPPTIQRMLDYAALKRVKLVPYVYPPLGYRSAGKDQAWLFPSSHCRGFCASLASVEFQNYFLQLLIDFAQVTGIGGYAWDYNFFYDSSHTEYSQWRGWQWVRTQLLITLPYLIMDHRYASQFDGPWSWITLNGYTSPLLSDENPETYPILYASLHTDKIAADFMRRGNTELRLDHFASMDAIPGFIGHQNERSAHDGSLPWTGNNRRDFDLMGFPYSLLSNIATAGLNLIHTSLPARDFQEFHLLPSQFIQFWSYWLSWTDNHQSEIRNAFPFNLEQDWSLIDPNGVDGFLFLFNPNYFQLNRTILLDGTLNLQKPSQQGYWLLKEIYPQSRFVQSIQYNQTIEVLLDGQSVTVYELQFIENIDQPILVGITGSSFIANQELLIINGVYGEAGTQTTEPVVVILPNNQSISRVLLNGDEKNFHQENQIITLSDPIIFPGIYLPRSAQIVNNTIVVSDLLLSQLASRQLDYPIQWTDEELDAAVWLGPHRLLLFICINNPKDQWNITAQINDSPISIRKAYNTRDHIVSERFMGFYLDLTNIVTEPNMRYHISLELPSLDPGQFQGLFLENIERILVEP